MDDKTPSKTAYKVALNILTLGEKPDLERVMPRGMVDATAQLLIASGAAGVKTVRRSRSPRMLRIYEAFDWMLPGQFEAFAHRKAFCERQVKMAIAAGASQVLLLGAGYDTMAWRLAPDFSHVGFFEIDHPATAALKAKGIQKMGKPSNLHLIAEDLGRHRLTDVLVENKVWDPNALTVFVAEGLLQYLMPHAVHDLFKQCASVAGESRIAFTYIPTREDGRPDAGPRTGFILWLLKMGKEPWLWSIRPEALGSFLEATGWANAPELVGTGKKYGVEMFAAALKSGQPMPES